jgi:hypothetical protein
MHAHLNFPILGGLKHNPIQIINHIVDKVTKEEETKLL